MGAVFSCCLKGLENLGIGAAKVNRRQALQSLLNDRENPNVDGRKNAPTPPAFDPPAPSGPSGVSRVGSVTRPGPPAMESPGSPPCSPTPSSLLNGRDRPGQDTKRTNFGSFQQRSTPR